MESDVKVQAMYLINQRSAVFNKFKSKLCMKQILSKKKKFVHSAAVKKKILAQAIGQKKNSSKPKIPHPPPPPPITFLMVRPLIIINYLIIIISPILAPFLTSLIDIPIKNFYPFIYIPPPHSPTHNFSLIFKR